MEEFYSVAETKEERQQLNFLLAELRAFAVDYIFSIRKVIPTLKYVDLSDAERNALVSFVEKLDANIVALFFKMLKVVEPVSGNLIEDEIKLFHEIDREMAEDADGESWKKGSANKSSQKSKSDNSVKTMDNKTRKEFENLIKSMSASSKKTEPKDSSEKKEEPAKKSFLKKLTDEFSKGYAEGKGKKPSKEDDDSKDSTDKPKRGRKKS